MHFSVYVGITSLRVQHLSISLGKCTNAAFKSAWDAPTYKCGSRNYDVMGVQVILVVIKLTDRAISYLFISTWRQTREVFEH